MIPELRIPDTIVSFNARVGRDGPDVVKSVRMILDDHPRTDALCFQECEGYIDELRRAFTGPNKGWFLYSHGGRTESRMNPVMVRKDPGFPRRRYGKGWGVVENQIDWIGPVHGNRHEGRTWTWVKVGQVYLLSLHRATDGNGQNKRAYQEEARKLTRFMQRGTRARHIIVFGDTNTGWSATHEGSMREIRKQVGGRLIADQRDPGVDYALTTRSIRANMERTKDYGSDHLAVVMRGIQLV